MQTRLHIIVTGRVQGIGYRVHCSREAKSLGVTGWVRNNPDGSVEVVAEGDDVAVNELADWCRAGHPFAKVQEVDVTVEEPRGEPSFRVIR